MTSPAPDAGVRPARPDDADAIGEVHARAWASSYGGLLPGGGVPAPQDLAQAWRQSLAAPPSPRHRVLVATAGPRLVGFAALAPAADADSDDTDAELLVLLVDPEAGTAGHDARLLNASADVLRDTGSTRVQVWVPEPDAERLAFLTGAGFALDGAARVLDASGDGSTTVREVRLGARLAVDA